MDHPTDGAAASGVPVGPTANTPPSNQETKSSAPPAGNLAPHAPAPAPKSTHSVRRRVITWAAVAVVVAAAAYYGIPFIWLSWNTVSTDDAYVNSHVTLVAARVPGQVTKVLVDDNFRVKKGDLLFQLDREPYEVQVAAKEANLQTAKADLDVAIATVHSTISQARSGRFKLEHAIENVNFQVAQLNAAVAALDSDLAVRDRALKDYNRIKQIAKTPGAAPPQDIDLALQQYLVAKAKVRQSIEGVRQIRAYLGLKDVPVNADELTAAPKAMAEVPADLDQTFSSVREAATELLRTVAPLGVYPSSFDLKPKQILDEFYKRHPSGDIDKIFEVIIKKAPPIEQARAKVAQAERDLDLAKLNLSYCDIRAEVDGVITRRNINPGNNVMAGQSVMAIRSLTEIWIDANFKETQLADLRIGQPVKIEVDMYGGREEFEGRITGFTMGTGQTLALLPPQNATGNFVKIVQRLPVKIELNNYNPDERPLFVGLSATPYVYFKKPLIGDDPGKGKALQPNRGDKSSADAK